MGNGVTAWSFSRWETYQQCPLKFKLKFIMKMQEPGSPAMDRGTRLHKAGEDYVKSKTKPKKIPEFYENFATELEHIRTSNHFVEQDWGYTRDWTWNGRNDWFGKDVWVRAKADVAVLYDDDTLLLGDWKSGKKYLKNEDQVRLFSLLGYKRFPHITEVDTRLWYLDAPKDDNEIQVTYKASEMPAIQRDWEKKVKAMFVDERWAPKANDKCKWCHFSAAKGGPCKF